MKKEEFIEKLIDMGGSDANLGTWESGWDEAISDVIEIAEKLDEPQKTTIPQFVADWIEDYCDHGGTIVDMLGSLTPEFDSVSSVDNEVIQWFKKNTDKMLRALMDGYEAEKEKRYQVKIPITVWDGDASELKEDTLFLAYNITSGETRILSATPRRGDFRTDLTEAEIKAIDKRYWDFV